MLFTSTIFKLVFVFFYSNIYNGALWYFDHLVEKMPMVIISDDENVSSINLLYPELF